MCRDAATNKSKNYGFISFTNKPVSNGNGNVKSFDGKVALSLLVLYTDIFLERNDSGHSIKVKLSSEVTKNWYWMMIILLYVN